METANERYPRIAGVNYESMVDGEGVRTTVFLSGCSHACPGCHNKAAQDPEFGAVCTDETIETIVDEFMKRPFLNGMTLSGGDPLFDPKKTACFLLALDAAFTERDANMPNVWIYTGYTCSEVLGSKSPGMGVILHYANILVDGRFEQEKADRTLAFRGSSNQRIWEQSSLDNIWWDATEWLDKEKI